jgi:hypothetical protein
MSSENGGLWAMEAVLARGEERVGFERVAGITL